MIPSKNWKKHYIFCCLIYIDKIAKENGLSFEVTELLFHAPFVEEYLEENIEIEEAKAIKVGEERKVN